MNIVQDEKTKLEIAKKIREARIKKGFTQSQVAEKAGMDTNSYAKIERGINSPLGVSLLKICKALGIKSSDVLSI